MKILLDFSKRLMESNNNVVKFHVHTSPFSSCRVIICNDNSLVYTVHTVVTVHSNIMYVIITMYVYMYIYVCMYVCMHACMCVSNLYHLAIVLWLVISQVCIATIIIIAYPS